MFAGDDFKQAADASYRNFKASPRFPIWSKVRRNNQIGTIDSWGPFFRISFDLIIHSFSRDLTKLGESSLLAFRGNGATCDKCKIGDRVPAFFLDNLFRLIMFSNTVDNLDHNFNFEVKKNQWYNIVIEQNSVNRKVMIIIMMMIS